LIPELPDPWGAYMRLQFDLDAITQINSHNWGLEAGLDAILAAAAAARHSDTPAVDSSINIASASRRERHHARLRRVYQSELAPTVDQPAVLEARVELAQVRRLLPPADWRLISTVAMGVDYQAIARNIGGTPGGLRIRALRIRQTLLRLVA
jgi:hypothetical protein